MSTSDKQGKAKAKREGNVTFIQKVIKGDTYLVMSDSAVEAEDEYRGLYFTTQASSNLFLEPPYEPKVLSKLVTQNNILSQCVDAMEVNIDGTGWDFEPLNPEEPLNEAEVEVLKSFFNEPYPNKSFLSIRRELRRDIESIGYGFLECLSNVNGELVAVRNVISHLVRLVKLDEAVSVTKKVMRAGKEIDLTTTERERRFVQRINNVNVYFKEFGASRHLNKRTGEWESESKPVDVKDRASELLYFGINKDTTTAYYTPRWINQLPSVVGSRKAEEQNLEFFDAGGLPPAIIFIQGGALSKEMSDQLKMYLSGQSKSRNRAVVVEAQSSSGTLDSSGNVNVSVERFGSESTNDAMFMNYDKASEEHIRTSFRLPPLFLGKAADYNFATAKTAYMVAEAQVFAPERKEFDEILNRTVLKALGVKNTVLKSNPITMKDIDTQLKALEAVKSMVEGEDVVSEVNKLTTMSLKYKEPPKMPEGFGAAPITTAVDGQPKPDEPLVPDKSVKDGKPATDNVVDMKTGKVPRGQQITKLARDYAIIEGYLTVKGEKLSEVDEQSVLEEVSKLDHQEKVLFDSVFSSLLLSGHDADLTCQH